LNRDVKFAFSRTPDFRIEFIFRLSGSLGIPARVRLRMFRFDAKFFACAAISFICGMPVGIPARAPLKSGSAGRPFIAFWKPAGRPVGMAARAPERSGMGGNPVGKPEIALERSGRGGSPVGKPDRAPERSGRRGNPVGRADRTPERSGRPPAKFGSPPTSGLGIFPASCDTPSTIGCSPCPSSPTLFIKSTGIKPLRSFAEFIRLSIIGRVVWLGVVVVGALVVVVVALVVAIVALVVTGGGVVMTTILRVDIAMVAALVVITTADFTVGFVVTINLVVTAPDLTVVTAGLVVATDFVVVTCLDFLDSGISAFSCSKLGSKTARQLTDDYKILTIIMPSKSEY
jgi:hypothetical protein